MPVEIEKVGPQAPQITPPAAGTDLVGHSREVSPQREVKRPHKMKALRRMIAPGTNALIPKDSTFDASDMERQSFLAHGSLAEDAVETGSSVTPAPATQKSAAPQKAK